MKYHVWISSLAPGAGVWDGWFDAEDEAAACEAAKSWAGNTVDGYPLEASVCGGCSECQGLRLRRQSWCLLETTKATYQRAEVVPHMDSIVGGVPQSGRYLRVTYRRMESDGMKPHTDIVSVADVIRQIVLE